MTEVTPRETMQGVCEGPRPEQQLPKTTQYTIDGVIIYVQAAAGPRPPPEGKTRPRPPNYNATAEASLNAI